MSSRYICPVEACLSTYTAPHVLCPRHWRMVPRELRFEMARATEGPDRADVIARIVRAVEDPV